MRKLSERGKGICEWRVRGACVSEPCEIDVLIMDIKRRVGAFGATRVAREAGVNRAHLYRALADDRNLEGNTIRKLEKALRELEGDL